MKSETEQRIKDLLIDTESLILDLKDCDGDFSFDVEVRVTYTEKVDGVSKTSHLCVES